MRAQATLVRPLAGVPALAVDLPRVARAIGVIVALVGTAMLASWWARAPLGPRAHPAMMPTTALAAALAGASLALRAASGPSGTTRVVISRVLALAVTAIGALTLAQYLLGIDLALERIACFGRAAGSLLPGPNTALAFTALGIALLAIEPRRSVGTRVAAVAAAIGAVIALTAFYGHVYGAAALHEATRSLRTTGMSVLTAIALLALSVGVVIARPRPGLARVLGGSRTAGHMARRLFAALFAVPVLGLLVTVGHTRGLYTQLESAALFAVAATLLGAAWIASTARALDRADEARDVAAAEAAKWKLFFEHADWGAALARPDGTLELVNDALAAQRGSSVDALRGLAFDALHTPDHRDEARAMLERNAANGHARIASEHVRSDGSTFPVRIAATALRDRAGRLLFHALQVDDVTEERAVEAQRARFASMVESAEDAVVAITVDGRLTEWNPAAERLYGWSASEMIGETYAPLVPPELHDDTERLFARLRRGLRVAPYETLLMHKDGRRIPVSVTVWPVIGRDGRVLMISASARDISARKEMEDELRRASETERRLRDELERVTRASSVVAEELAALPDTSRASLLHTIALQAQLLTCADAVAVAIGSDPGQRFEDWAVIGIDPELERELGRPHAIGTLGSVAASGEIVLTGDVATHAAFGGLRDGPPRLHALAAVPIVHRGRPVGSLFVASTQKGEVFAEADVRVLRMLAARVGPAIETARAYEAVSLKSAWLSAVIEQMPEGVVLTDEHGRIVSQNEAARRLARDGASGAAAIDTLYEMVDARGAPLPETERPLSRALERHESAAGIELAVRTTEGRAVPILASATPVRVGERVVGAVLVFRDISVVKELERMRDEWSSIIAHDLRQPLSVISMSTGLLRHVITLRPSERKTLDRIQSSTRTLTRMVEDLLDASRIESRRLSITQREIDVGALAREVVERNTNLLAGHELQLVEHGTATVRGDAQRLEQVLVNLISNAHKYGDPGTPIRIEVLADAEPNEVDVLVSNRGRGIAPEELPHVFDRFSRSRAARSSKTEGLGLGLYICRGIVEAHGGRIRAESTPGDTTTFRITLPRIA
ncbi:PAS domain S-box protein [Sandaracinus amylolyticus]|uniref:histidine kinase n=1 Tax=Sandaracinus amylolyticus TaxID=927083 RepID=A0A0F6W9L8_9BACT|nr:PAS domain S-box protein [Sandaracinus amylolyticus]AKF10962.1 Two-component sensor histidine kinase [Sandaracinus amylolyticus]